jgi:SAM-dependent methyltransferase
VCLHDDAVTTVQKTVQNLPLEFSLCRNCGVIYQNPRLTKDALSLYFSSDIFIDDPKDNLDELLGYPDYFAWDTSYARTAHLRLKRIVRFKKPPGELLEIGSATGSFLDAARQIGFSVRGLDLSSAFAAIARKKGLEIDVDYIEDSRLSEARYDVVCNFGGIACWRDPIRALKNIHRSLKADGIFVFNYFDVDSLPGRILGDRHFEYNHASLIIFSRKTMQRCLRESGFEVIFSQNERQVATLGRVVGYLKQKTVLRALRAVGLEDVTIPLIVPGTVFSICRKASVQSLLGR